jgi:hypothetical protein
MVWTTVERKVIGTVVISEEAPTTPTTPPMPPSPVIASFLEEHRRLKAIIDRYGAKGTCITRGTLESEGEVTGERLDKHIRVFEDSDAASPITEEGEEVLCGKSAIKELKRKLEVDL